MSGTESSPFPWLQPENCFGSSRGKGKFQLLPPSPALPSPGDEATSGDPKLALHIGLGLNKPLKPSPDSFNCFVLTSSFFPTGKYKNLFLGKERSCPIAWCAERETRLSREIRLCRASQSQASLSCRPFPDSYPQSWLKKPFIGFALGFHRAPSADRLPKGISELLFLREHIPSCGLW